LHQPKTVNDDLRGARIAYAEFLQSRAFLLISARK